MINSTYTRRTDFNSTSQADVEKLVKELNELIKKLDSTSTEKNHNFKTETKK